MRHHGLGRGGSRASYRLDRVRVYVALRYSSDITLAAAAQVAGLEPTYFSKFFSRNTGMLFRDWLARIRVDYAKELLRDRDLPITEVASRVGFGSTRTLERHFLRQTGSTPRTFRALTTKERHQRKQAPR